TYSFTGPMNNGSLTATTSYTTTAGAVNKGFNLVPNPYPSAIDWEASAWTKTNIDNAIYVWNSGVSTTNYASYINGSSTNGGSRYIAPGQSFFVHANALSPALTMDNNVRLHNSVSFLKNDSILPDLLKIHADAVGASDEIVVRFADGATAGFDSQWDAFKMSGGTNAPQLYSVTADSISLAINSLPLSAAEVIVPLNFSFSAAASVTFTAGGMDSFKSATSIYLEDKALSKMINLRQEPVYTFNYQSGSASGRFNLHFNGITGIGENKTAVSGKAFISNGRIYLDVPSMQGQPASITLYNTLGQVIRSQEKTMDGIISIEALLAQGVYIVKVSSASRNFITKVIKN
ncbi:MAG: T9SS type A sorting domain-containing protein, partial [Bacteroidota bacterium]